MRNIIKNEESSLPLTLITILSTFVLVIFLGYSLTTSSVKETYSSNWCDLKEGTECTSNYSNGGCQCSCTSPHNNEYKIYSNCTYTTPTPTPVPVSCTCYYCSFGQETSATVTGTGTCPSICQNSRYTNASSSHVSCGATSAPTVDPGVNNDGECTNCTPTPTNCSTSGYENLTESACNSRISQCVTGYTGSCKKQSNGCYNLSCDPVTSTPTPTPTAAPTVDPTSDPSKCMTQTDCNSKAAKCTYGQTSTSCKTADSKGCYTYSCKSAPSNPTNPTTKPGNTATPTPSGNSPTATNTPTPSNGGDSNTDTNPKTGTTGIAIAWFAGIFALAASFFYFKKESEF